MISAIVVDDEDVIRDSLCDFIDWNKLGIQSVACASDGMEAITLSRQIKPDIIISDIRMPRLSGIAFVGEVRKLLPNCKIIFISGYSDKEYLKSAIELKAISFVEKPINLGEITAAVQKAVDEIKNDSLVGTLLHKNRILSQELAVQLCKPIQLPEVITKKIQNVNSALLSCSQYRSVIIRFPAFQNQVEYTSLNDEQFILMQSVFETAFQAFLVVPVDSSRIVMHISDSSTTDNVLFKNSIDNCMAELRMKSNTAVKAFIAIGISVYGLHNIYQSYETALAAEQQLFYKGFGNMVFYQPQTTKSESPFIYEPQQAAAFETALRAGNSQFSNQWIDSLVDALQQHPSTNVDYIKDIFFKLSQKILDIAFERGVKQGENQEDFRKYLWKMISEKETLQDMVEDFNERLAVYFNHLNSITGNKSVSEINLYIEKNYAHSELSIGKISEAVHLTESHICHIFKQSTGKTLNQYITEYRIDRAKEFLRNRQAKLVEIAEKVGYTDANYFTRTFKKMVGMTPSEYRDRYLL